MAIVDVSDETFDTEVLQSSTPVLVDFWADWCGPCKALTPTLEELAGEMGDKVKIVKVNLDVGQNTAIKYGARGVPFLVVFKDGQVVDQRAGALPKSALEDWINQSV